MCRQFVVLFVLSCLFACVEQQDPGPLETARDIRAGGAEGIAPEPLGEPECDEARCCPEGTAPAPIREDARRVRRPPADGCMVLGAEVDRYNNRGYRAVMSGDGDDVITGFQGVEMLSAGNGDDTVRSGNGADEVYGGRGSDSIHTGNGADLADGGPGNDVLHGGRGADTLLGRAGDDRIFGENGNDTIVPGEGADFVRAGPGDDRVVIRNLCEVAPGETLDGGPGDDELVVPVPLEQLLPLGLRVRGFERVRVSEAERFLSECFHCGCRMVRGRIECCSGRGRCETERVGECACDVGSLGPVCDRPEGHDTADDIEGPCLTCPEDPGVMRLFDDHCTLASDSNGVFNPFQCSVELAPGQFKDIRWILDHPAPDPGGNPPPPCEDDWVPGEVYPVVLVVHGAGSIQDYLNYGPLLEHLALNGFITISIDVTDPFSGSINGTTAQERADMLLRFIECLKTPSPENFIYPHWNGDLGLLGHSRGGDAVVRASVDPALAQDPDVNNAAVFSLAPANNPWDGGPTAGPDGDVPNSDPSCLDTMLDGSHTPAYLVMNGTRDQDTGYKGAAFYDAAGSETSASAVDPSRLTKSMVTLIRGSHEGFSDCFDEDVHACPDGFQNAPPEGGLHTETHHAVLLAWANAFFRRNLSGEEDFKDYLTGLSTSANAQQVAEDTGDGPLFTYHQHSEGFGTRHRVVDNFECRSASCNTDGNLLCWQEPSGAELLSRDPDTIEVDEIRLEDLTGYSNQRTRSLITRWTEPFGTVPAIEYELADLNSGTPFGANNVSGFTHLSFRVSQVPDFLLFDSPVNGEPEDPGSFEPADLYVRLTDEAGASSRVRVSEVAELYDDIFGEPNPFYDRIDFPDDPFGAVRGHYQTIRIPLHAFCDVVDLRRLESLSFELDADVDLVSLDIALLKGFLALDNIEFVDEPSQGFGGPLCLHPCGNGVINPDEQCDGFNLNGQTCSDFGFNAGSLSCRSDCTVDTSQCQNVGPGPEPGDDRIPCNEDLEIGNEGIAGYFQEGRFCDFEHFICRQDGVDEDDDPLWSCFNCGAQEDSGEGCPCSSDAECRPGLSCWGSFDHPGACWSQLPPGYCYDNCASVNDICARVLSPGFSHVCVAPECACGASIQTLSWCNNPSIPCELFGDTCHRQELSCVPPQCFDDLDCALIGLQCVGGECVP